ncbi:sensor histidine kinase [Facklamia miroungae]|uniref:histidine kinase n=1 Tax=Facklamia miroungae TaxID=120956 RepID=A0A1G7RRS7_9LACT|nr:sensor histidine kinase [Facklamia miroungae]NKZ29300.1 sensor histidine kinase [Facklamia miroungae]SDG13516.1 Signal transduction histidine kinase [Facklamia miroungae]
MLLNHFRYTLICFGLIEYLLLHQTSINWLDMSCMLIWIVLLQTAWFIVSSDKLRRIMLFLAMMFGIALSYYNHQLYVFMLMLNLGESALNFTDRSFHVISGLLIINGAILTYLYPLEINIIMSLVLLVANIILLQIRPMIQEYYRLKDAYYQQERERQEQIESTKYLMNHIQTMKDLYILNERNRISRDIHDSIGHVLSTIIIQLGAIGSLTKTTQPQVSQMTQELRDFSAKGLQDIRQIVHEMKPVEFQRAEFMVRIKELLNEFEHLSGIRVLINHNEPMWQLNSAQEAVLYRAIQEFISNSAKYGEASEIRINIHYTDDALILNMADDGKGTDHITPHLGLMGLEERVHQIGGKVSFHSSSGQGFKTRLVVNKGGRNYEDSLS